MVWFWRFAGFGFLGFLLETAHARMTGDGSDRKCLLVLPLCPVYGLGGCVCALLEPLSDGSPLGMLLLGGAGCTAVEYGMAAWYEWCAGTPFWDYTGRTGSVRGRVCLAYSVLWGILSLTAVYGVLPPLDRLSSLVPGPVAAAACLAVTADLAASHILLHRTRDRACLRRYGFPKRRGGLFRRGLSRQTENGVRELDAAP
ncbi:MAG: putative ABC transporter permease [Oscillibacter sp.]|nr:putative ABC transporter permease [Oscillibacter sp.]